MNEPHDKPAGTTHFGYRDVPVDEKEKLVGRVFHVGRGEVRPDERPDVARRASHLERWFVSTSGVREGDRVLDLAGGTARYRRAAVARASARRAASCSATSTRQCCAPGATGCSTAGSCATSTMRSSNAEALPFRTRASTRSRLRSDCATSPTRRSRCAKCSACSSRRPRARARIFRGAVRVAQAAVTNSIRSRYVPRLGEFIANDSESYRYLAESIRKHPDQATLKSMMEAAGFGQVDVRNLSAGIVAIHRGYKF
jgi:demethylmenaquinone methyltransferase/2-methoxy-6-polyprenyl-1,4-benzoquinol methylase